MIRWHFVTSTVYKTESEKIIDNDLYFLSDTKEIYRGHNLFSEAVTMVTSWPAENIAKNRLYINSTTLEGRIHNGSAWNTVIKPIDNEITADSNSENPVSAKAVAAFVAAQLATISASTEVVHSLSWDSAEHILTVTKGAGETAVTSDITFDGLGVSLSYVSETGDLQLLDASGNKIGDPINLPKEQFVTAGEYDAENNQIILYFDAEKTNSVTIDATGLVDVYTGEETSSAKVEVSSDNKISATVKISSADGNTITLKEDGIYVSVPDMSDYMLKVPEATEGHLVTLDASGQVVDSGKSFEDLATNSKVYEGASIDEALNGATPVKGDICVVNAAIGDTGKIQKTAHYFDGTNWVAFDGNYDARNVYFHDDLQTTSKVGIITTLTGGQATIAAKGKNLVDVWNTIFVKEENPKATQPSVSFTTIPGAYKNSANQTVACYEVGSVVTPSYVAKLNAGSYSYGPATGITADSWEVTSSDGGKLTSNSGSFDAITVGDDTSYTVTAKATYNNDGTIPVTNTGNEYPSVQIKAGSKSATSSPAITGFRKAFWGYSTDLLGQADINSAVIRGLQNSSEAAVAVGSKFNVNFVAGTKTVVIAYPATIADMTTVIDTGAMNTPIQKAHDFTVDVEGKNGYEAKSYKVWLYNFADGASADNTYEVTI